MQTQLDSPLAFDRLTVRIAAQDLWAYVKRPAYIAVDNNLTTTQKIHVNNYFFAIPLVSSQLFAGYAWGYVRMRFGLWYSIGLHIVWNFMCSIGLLVMLIKEWI